MSSIVIELQRESLDRKVATTDLLRKALVVAKKLKVEEFEKWIKIELNGYGDTAFNDMPEYRMIFGTVKAWNPYHGWQEVLFGSSKLEQNLSRRHNSQSISEIEHMLSNSEPGGIFHISFPADLTKDLMNSMQVPLQPSLHVQPSALAKILDAVRNIVLNWSLTLEEDGILGNGLAFTKQEVETASTANYTINNFSGDVINSQIQQGTSDSQQTVKKK